jgi:hypothetical protein
MQLSVCWLLYLVEMGAYTELWAGLSPDLTENPNGGYVTPWGRIHPVPRGDLVDSLKGVEEGGKGRAAQFWDWCEKEAACFK